MGQKFNSYLLNFVVSYLWPVTSNISEGTNRLLDHNWIDEFNPRAFSNCSLTLVHRALIIALIKKFIVF